MIWQDWVLTAGSVFFSATLLPTCLDERTSIPRYKSLPTAIILAVFAATQWTMGLRVVPFTEIVCALCWAFIAWRRAPAPAWEETRPWGSDWRTIYNSLD